MGFICPKDCNPADFYMSIMHRNNPKNVEHYPVYYKTYEEQMHP